MRTTDAGELETILQEAMLNGGTKFNLGWPGLFSPHNQLLSMRVSFFCITVKRSTLNVCLFVCLFVCLLIDMIKLMHLFISVYLIH